MTDRRPKRACAICHNTYFNLRDHITRIHKRTISDYEKEYGFLIKPYMGITCRHDFDKHLKKLAKKAMPKKLCVNDLNEKEMYLAKKYYSTFTKAKEANEISINKLIK